MKMNSGVATKSAVEMILTCLRYVQLGLKIVPDVGHADLNETFNPILHVFLRYHLYCCCYVHTVTCEFIVTLIIQVDWMP